MRGFWLTLTVAASLAYPPQRCRGEAPVGRTYENKLTPLRDAAPLLADFPDFVEPVRETRRFEAPALIEDADGDLAVRAWRFSYNARGVVEMPNTLKAKETAIVVVHPWGIDDGQGWTTPEPAGVAFQCTVEKNKLVNRHMSEALDPFLKKLRDRVGIVGYSLPGKEDPLRKKLYRSVRGEPTAAEREQGAKELSAALAAFDYRGEPLPAAIELSGDHPLTDYFRAFGGTDASDRFNAPGFWKLPIPVSRHLEVGERDVVFYDGEGYEAIRDFLEAQGIRHVLLTGYNTDMCFCSTTAGYENLAPDFNVFLVGDATIATFPANPTPRFATNAAICLASREHLVTQISWVQPREAKAAAASEPKTAPRKKKES